MNSVYERRGVELIVTLLRGISRLRTPASFVGDAQDGAVDLDAQLLRPKDRVECDVPRNIADLDRHRNVLDRLVDDEIDAVLFGDVVEDVADVGIDDV